MPEMLPVYREALEVESIACYTTKMASLLEMGNPIGLMLS